MMMPIMAIRMGNTVLVLNAKFVKKLLLPISVSATRGTEKKDVPFALTK